MENSSPVNKKNNKADDIDQRLKEFKDLEGLSVNKLNFGLWYVEHIKQFRLIFIIILIAVSAISWTYTIFGFAYYFVRGIDEDKILVKQLIETKIIDHSYIAQFANKDLEIYPAQALLSDHKKYDFLAQIKNVNLKSYGKFNYYFLVDNQKTKQQSGFILPGESKYLLALSQDFPYQPSSVQLVIENLNWIKISHRQIADWQDYYNNHLDIINTDIKFIPANQSELSQKLGLNQISYNSFNRTAYNFWKVDYVILFFSGNAVVNVNKYTLDNFMSSQIRLVQLNWAGNIGRVDEIKIIPEIDIMSKDIYIKYEGKVENP